MGQHVYILKAQKNGAARPVQRETDMRTARQHQKRLEKKGYEVRIFRRAMRGQDFLQTA